MVKWPGHETEHAIPSGAQVKNEWSYISTPPFVFMGWCVIKKH